MEMFWDENKSYTILKLIFWSIDISAAFDIIDQIFAINKYCIVFEVTWLVSFILVEKPMNVFTKMVFGQILEENWHWF